MRVRKRRSWQGRKKPWFFGASRRANADSYCRGWIGDLGLARVIAGAGRCGGFGESEALGKVRSLGIEDEKEV